MSPRNADQLREGFTTGSASAAAAKAAALFLLTGERAATVSIPLPDAAAATGPDTATRLDIPIESIEPLPGAEHAARAVVIKDGGDDPDATHRARIEVDLFLDFTDDSGHILLEGGKGVGVVTLPGLPVAVGEPAINPGPRSQITAAVREALAETGRQGGETAHGARATPSVRVRIRVPEGEAIATRTLNPRLGIRGGISILGTRGTVRPYSHEAWEATIRQGLDVARADGQRTVGFTTGRRSERLLLAAKPDLPEIACIQAADFFGLAMAEAARRGFDEVLWSCFFGKLVKQAQGHFYTHARTAPIDFALLAEWCREAGAREDEAANVAGANTALMALDILARPALRDEVLLGVARRALARARDFAQADKGPRLAYYVFDFDGTLLMHVKE